MKITTEVPDPLPITWHLELTDDEMAVLLWATYRHSIIDAEPQLVSLLGSFLDGKTWTRLLARGEELTVDLDAAVSA